MVYFWNVIGPLVIAGLVISAYVLFREREILRLKLELSIARSIIKALQTEANKGG